MLLTCEEFNLKVFAARLSSKKQLSGQRTYALMYAFTKRPPHKLLDKTIRSTTAFEQSTQFGTAVLIVLVKDKPWQTDFS